MTFAPVGYRYVALRPLTVEGFGEDGRVVTHVLAPGDMVPEDVAWRSPHLWVESGHMAPVAPSNKPGRSPRSIDITAPALGVPIPDHQVLATFDTSGPLVAAPLEVRADWEDLTGKPSPDGYPPFTGEEEARELAAIARARAEAGARGRSEAGVKGGAAPAIAAKVVADGNVDGIYDTGA